MKRILLAFAAFVASASFGATLTPVQLLNPAGSTTGQAIVSTGASSAPTWGNVSATTLAAQAANTVIANVTGSSASPTAFAMPSCSTSTSALQWTSGTGFVCGSSFASLTGATFTGPVVINDPTSSGASSLKVSATSDTNGGNLLIVGNGATTPSKTIRVLGGVFQIVNNAYTSALMNLDDSGNSTFSGTVKASGAAHLCYKNSNGQSLNSTPATITNWTSIYDANSNFNATTGIFTAPATGFYQISGQIAVLLTTPPVGSQTQAIVVANSVTLLAATHVAGTTAETESVIPFSMVVSLTAGQTALLQGYSSTTFPMSTSATLNVLCISQIP